MISATQDGFAAPSTSKVNSIVHLRAAGDVLHRRAASTPRRSFEPTGTGDGKRTLLAP